MTFQIFRAIKVVNKGLAHAGLRRGVSKFAYLRIDTPGIKDERFVRIFKESVDHEFNQMRKDEHRTFPFLVFDLGTRKESDNYVQVLCSRLRSVSASKTDALDQAWK